MSKASNKAKRVAALVAERRKLKVRWDTNQQSRFKLQHKLDRATTKLARATGLEAAPRSTR